MVILHFILSIAVTVRAEEIQELTVAAPLIQNSVESFLEIRKKNNTVSEVLGRESMTRSGDSDAASSLKRVTGLTLVNGKFVFVRGLGDRYSSVLMNGSQVPSPEPTRRVVPLDLFPISMLESITVQKSFSPERPSEFGGGLIELTSRELPKEFSGSMSIGFSSDRFESGLGYQGGSSDYLGMDDGTRAMPELIKQAFKSKKKIIVSPTEGFTEKEIEAMGTSLSNHYNVKKSENNILPNIQATFGDSTTFRNYRLGGIFSSIYSSSNDVGEKYSKNLNVGGEGKLEEDDNSKTQFMESEVQLGGALTLGINYKENQKIKINSILLRNSTNSTQEKITTKKSDSFPTRKYTSFDWAERQVFFNQLSGEHDLEEIKIKWRGNYSVATRDNPDSREIMRNEENGVYVLETDVSGNKRVFSELKDTSNEYGLDLDIPVYESKVFKNSLKIGSVYNSKDRQSDVYRLHFKNNYTNGTIPDLSAPTDDLLKKRGSDKFFLTNITDSADSFNGKQTIVGNYFLVTNELYEKLTFQFGMRQENSKQEVKTYKYYAPDIPTSSGFLKMVDRLPSYGVSFNFSDSQKIKFAYGETIARPDFRELSTVTYIEDETGYDVIGNSKLKGTVIKNIDLRFENYFDDTNYFSLGVFQKKFVNPIEAVFQPGDKLVKTFMNAKSAKSFGVEVEGRYGLRDISRYLRRWTIASNASWIKSNVDIDESEGNQTSKVRPLQGQSPYVVNFQVLYDRPQLKLTSGLIFNVVGKRITEVGTNQRPDIYEQPFNELDFVLNQKIDQWGYGIKIKNLLDSTAKSTQGTEVVRSRKKGRTYAASVSAYF